MKKIITTNEPVVRRYGRNAITYVGGKNSDYKAYREGDKHTKFMRGGVRADSETKSMRRNAEKSFGKALERKKK